MTDLGNNPEEEIFKRVQGYLQGQISLSELDEWTVLNVDDLFRPEKTTRAADLAARIFSMGTFELRDGLITEEKLKEELREFLETGAFPDNPQQSRER